MNLPQDNEALRDTIIQIKHRRDYHLMDEPEYIDEIMALFTAEQTRLKADKHAVPQEIAREGSMKKIKCFRCNGRGTEERSVFNMPFFNISESQNCPACHGKGWIYD